MLKTSMRLILVNPGNLIFSYHISFNKLMKSVQYRYKTQS